MKDVKLRMKENTKYKVIKELVDHNDNKKTCLLLAVDKATNTIHGAYFDY